MEDIKIICNYSDTFAKNLFKNYEAYINEGIQFINENHLGADRRLIETLILNPIVSLLSANINVLCNMYKNDHDFFNHIKNEIDENLNRMLHEYQKLEQ